MLSRASVLLLSAAVLSCGRGRAPDAAQSTPTSAPSVAPLAAESPPPSAPACEGLWGEYHGIVPESPFVDHEAFIARCVRSEAAVLGCVARTKAEIEAMFDEDRPRDAGPPEPTPPTILSFAMATRIGICMTRERLRLALRTGELDRLARELVSDGVAAGPHGTRLVAGAYATLPWRGMHEHARTVEPAPPGEIRVSRRPDGRVWIYFLGSLLGRHQNQIGFLYASAPFAPGDFTSEREQQTGPARDRVCLGSDSTGHDPAELYMLECFDVIARLSPQLIEVGAAPD